MKEAGACVTDCNPSLVEGVCGGRSDGVVTGCGVAQSFWLSFFACSIYDLGNRSGSPRFDVPS